MAGDGGGWSVGRAVVTPTDATALGPSAWGCRCPWPPGQCPNSVRLLFGCLRGTGLCGRPRPSGMHGCAQPAPRRPVPRRACGLRGLCGHAPVAGRRSVGAGWWAWAMAWALQLHVANQARQPYGVAFLATLALAASVSGGCGPLCGGDDPTQIWA